MTEQPSPRAVLHEPWPAPGAGGPVRATVALPGSKSLTNRALVLAALSGAPSAISAPLRSRDTVLMADGLRALGIGIDERAEAGAEVWTVTPRPPAGPADLDVGNAGTVLRFLPPVAALGTGPVRFDGDPRARERPLGPLVAALRELGAVVHDEGRGAIPLVVDGTGALRGGVVEIDASSSSQLVSALLLVGPRTVQGVEVRHVGRSAVPSAPHLRMTEECLRAAGASVVADGPTWRVAAGPLAAPDLVVEPDLSNAAPFLAAAVATGGAVHVPRWPARTSQAGDALRGLLTAMGGECALDADGLTVTGTGSVRGLDADLHEVGELVPVLAALAALAGSPSYLRGVAHLRGHETDRLAALAREINGLGGDVREAADGLEIRPTTLHGGVFRTYDDHRMAMAGAVLGLVVAGVRIENVATTGKTLPGFVALWEDMLGVSR
jgi:3-phosphoshikimate 1-carboxyvinyltransferase